ncbi:hypothetical protein [Micromonospora echinofusca]|uniref:Uncharacterized protein n=1 Tax=Micromonospora echinofusca TaxID=47858 RepID=A0ABS3VTI5_MICEH|nr:hypothetical protein [Micromonospora echinofusca]MBO4207856.1 hypothetical protein [Micromonospora echinofusca]
MVTATDVPDPDPQASFHRLLLRLAGHTPPEIMPALRQWLAEGRLTEVTNAVYTVAVTWGVALPAVDAELLATVVPEHPQAGMLTQLSGTARPAVPPYAFAPVPPGAVVWSGNDPQLLDLTTVHADLAAVAADEVDAVAVETAGAEPGAVALWRAWRLRSSAHAQEPPVRVYLLEADRPTADLPAVAARLQRALYDVGLPDPQVEVYHPGLDLPDYQRLARGGSALLWTATTAEPVTIARVFDRVDPIGGPQFDPDHERIADSAERDRILDYLRAGVPLLSTTAREPDHLDPDRAVVVPLTFRTDGHWIWTDAVGYYLQVHGMSPDARLLTHIRQAGYRTPTVDQVAIHRGLAVLQGPIRVTTG